MPRRCRRAASRSRAATCPYRRRRATVRPRARIGARRCPCLDRRRRSGDRPGGSSTVRHRPGYHPRAMSPISSPGLRSLTGSLRRRRGVVVGAIAVVAVAGGLVLVALTRSPGPPGAPGPIVAEASTCGDPCVTLEPKVTLEWPRPITGSEPTGYLVLRDASPIQEVGPSERTYIDLGVAMGSTHEYQVVATSEDGDSAATVSVEAT